MVVFSQEYGFPVAIVQDNGWLTDLRTAAAGALAAKSCLPANKNGLKAAILGTGIQARMQLEAISEVASIESVSVWGRTVANRDKLVHAFKESDLNIPLFQSADSVDDCVRDADLIICTTASTSPILKLAQIKKGATIVAMGSDTRGKSEVEGEVLNELLKSSGRVICDKVEQCCRVGECQDVSEDLRSKLIEFGDVVTGKTSGRGSDDETILIDLTGVGAQDAAIASLAVEMLNIA